MKRTIYRVSVLISILTLVVGWTVWARQIDTQSFSYVIDYSREFGPPYFVLNYNDTSPITSVSATSSANNVGFYLRVPDRVSESKDLSYITVKFGPFMIGGKESGLVYDIEMYNFTQKGLQFNASGQQSYSTNLGTGNKTYESHEYFQFRIEYDFQNSDFSKFSGDDNLESLVTVEVNGG